MIQMRKLLVVSLSLIRISACPFCDKEVLDRQTFYEKDSARALYTHKPILPTHFLIIPKRHVERYEELTEEELLDISKMIKHVDTVAATHFGTSSYLLLQKNGRDMGQSVSHLHFHYIAGKTNGLSFFTKMLWANLKAPLSRSEMKQIVKSLREAN